MSLFIHADLLLLLLESLHIGVGPFLHFEEVAFEERIVDS